MKVSELKNLIREEVRKVLKEAVTDNVYPIHMRIAKIFNMDMYDLQETCDDEYSLSKYTLNKDYKWNIARGDDFPDSMVIMNQSMLSDPEIKMLLRFLSGK